MAVRRFSAGDLFASTSALLILAGACAPESVWKDVTPAREHVPTGLTFPDHIDGLQRTPIAPASPSTGQVEIFYASEGSTGLRIALTPLTKGQEPDLQLTLRERMRSRATSLPLRREPPAGSFPVLCDSGEVTFAYRTLAQTPTTRGEPITGYSLNVESNSLSKFDWWFATELSGHLVVIESQISRHAGLYYGADLVLRDLIDPLGWPCSLPVSKLEQATQEKAAQEIERITPPERSWRQSAGILLARAVPAGAFDESSTLGPRPVHRDPLPGTYAHARSTGRPHTCEISAPSFFGEREEYVAYVEGDDFYAPGRHIHFARLGGVGYTWSNEELDERVVRLGMIRFEAYTDAYERLMHHAPPRWEDTFSFVEPAEYEPCTPAEPQQITIPDREFRDVTDELIARWRQYFDASVEALETSPFSPLLPHASLADLFPATRGYAGSTGYSVQYLAHGAGPQGESSELSIGFRAHTSEEPASQCGKDRIARSCEHVMTTSRGVEVFRDLHFAGSSSSNPALPHYHAKVGDALVKLNYIYWSQGGPRGAAGWRAHDFAEGELAAVFDSLQAVTAEDIVRFPGMSVSQ